MSLIPQVSKAILFSSLLELHLALRNQPSGFQVFFNWCCRGSFTAPLKVCSAFRRGSKGNSRIAQRFSFCFPCLSTQKGYPQTTPTTRWCPLSPPMDQILYFLKHLASGIKGLIWVSPWLFEKGDLQPGGRTRSFCSY